MIKFSKLLVFSVLIGCLICSGCMENEASKIEEKSLSPEEEQEEEQISEDLEKTPVDSEYAALETPELLQLESDMAELEALLEDINPDEELVIEEL
ncbi:MAG: hypothetical protein PHD41_02555 [Methanosarcinaceae archaeon]|nr:hypothetical protein [Methanosarcinaceae archaeon]MDD4331261.1 hypothetical protein [Methanosarcinaceae archaeon]MDD4748773.1 hypothetical protein [Methanosarcinaceae archaeon]